MNVCSSIRSYLSFQDHPKNADFRQASKAVLNSIRNGHWFATRLRYGESDLEDGMAVMIVREISGHGEREYELNRENIRTIISQTGLDETTIYTMLNTGEPIQSGDHSWVMIRQ